MNKGADGFIPLANICTATGKTNRPIAYLYLLEITAAKESTRSTLQTDDQSKQSSSQKRSIKSEGVGCLPGGCHEH